MNRRLGTLVFVCLFGAFAAALAGCNGGGDDEKGIFAGLDFRTFWAADLTTGEYYQLRAKLLGQGSACYVYGEEGRTVPQETVDSLIAQFDGTIYARTTGAFGSEPNPGIDGDPKVYILLLDIRDGFSGGGYVAGYFDPANEFLDATVTPTARSNEKEIFYVDLDPGVVGDLTSLRTLSHEFQHMIHFNQEELAKGGGNDDAWLNEAMSMIASIYCNYGPDYLSAYTFQSEPWNSLTGWPGTVEDYGVAYMWAQYVKDRVDPFSPGNTVFWRMLHNPLLGIASVDNALAEIGYGKDFTGVFRDWAVANYSGTSVSWPGNPEWSYTTIDTWPGLYPVGEGFGIILPGLFGTPNQTALAGLEPWSVNYYLYTPLSGSTGTVTWTAGSAGARASLGDNTTLTFDMISGVAAPYTGSGYLIDVNPSGANNAANGAAFTSLRPRAATARDILAAARSNPSVRRIVAMTGKPFPLCVHPHFREKVRALKERGIRPTLVREAGLPGAVPSP